ncbi:MAG: hypothetical protein NTY83_03610, partial [Candidatus Micrarchaeota archaeon]|nr:hypothetical protein [Candidatus Micrarchaeota archaeon]
MAEEKKKKRKRGKCAIYVNGNLVGFHQDGAGLVTRIREKRRTNELNYEINAFFNERANEIYINTDAGRVRKPYVVVENGKSRFTQEISKKLQAGQLSWEHLIKMGVIEYLDAE